MSINASILRRELQALANPAKAKLLAGFFKTGPGQYGEGDLFLGITVPQLRAVVKAHPGLPVKEAVALLKTGRHEERLCALLFLVDAYQRAADDAGRGDAVRAYLAHLHKVNNWDLVDASAHQILGEWMVERSRAPLRTLAASKVMWERRVAMVATYAFIRRGESKDTLDLAERLLGDPQDLMHKAVGWMLREVGKQVAMADLRGFLKKHAESMPRTALRYAIERMEPMERKKWMGTQGWGF